MMKKFKGRQTTKQGTSLKQTHERNLWNNSRLRVHK